MKTEVKTVTITCDLCGKPTADPWKDVSETRPYGVISLSYDIWYGGTYDVKDTCQHCQDKMADFLRANDMIGNGQKRK